MKDTIEPGLLGWGTATAVIAIAVAGWCWQPKAVAQSATASASDKKVASKRATKKVAKRAVPVNAPSKRAVAKKAAPAPSAAPPQKTAMAAPSVRLVGALLLPNLDASLKRLMKVVELAAARELKKISQEVIRNGISRVFPNLKQVNLHRGVELLPSMIKPLGIDLSRPAGLAVWAYGQGSRHKAVPTLMLTVNPGLLMASLRLLGFSPRVTNVGGGRMLSLGSGGNGNAVGLLYGNTLYVTARSMARELGLSSETKIRAFFAQLALQDGPLTSAFTKAGRGGLWRQVKAGGQDVVLFAPGLGRILGSRGLLVTRYLKAVGASLSLKYGLRLRMFLDAAPAIKPALSPFAPGAHAKDLFPLVPHNLLLFGQGHLQLDKLVALPQKLVQMGVLNPFMGMMAVSQIGGFRSQMARNGLNFDQIIGLLSGQFAAGVIWDRELRASFSRSMRTLFRGHMHGAFFLIGLKSAAGGSQLLSMLLKAYQDLAKKQPIAAKRLQVTKVTSQGATCLQLTPTRQQPMFFCHKGTLVGFAGSALTRDHLLAVWGGAAPSLAQHLKQHPKHASFFGQTSGNFFALHPVYLRQLFVEVARLAARTPAATTFVQKLDQLAFSTRFKGGTVDASFAIKLVQKGLLPLPAKYSGPASTLPTSGRNMGLGYLAVLAGPAALAGLPLVIPGAATAMILRRQRRAMRRYRRPRYRRYRRNRRYRRYRRGKRSRWASGRRSIRARQTSRVRILIKNITDGAIAYFNAEHSDSQGNPLPRQFPRDKYTSSSSVGSFSVVTPAQKPCASGKARYPKNVKHWETNVWRDLKFAIVRPHFFQFHYSTKGTGSNASFTIRAHADLDCDGTLSTYQQIGSINKTTGEVERTPLVVIKGLE